MKIFFDASITGKRYYLENYNAILRILGNYKYQTTPGFQSTPEQIAAERPEDAERFFRGLEKHIRESDLGIFEVSYPSLGIGFEVARFLELSKPVIALHIQERKPLFLESVLNDRLQVLNYDLNSLSTVIENALIYASEQLDTRFTMLLPPDVNTYLDEVAKSGVSRSEYIRDLIRKHKEGMSK